MGQIQLPNLDYWMLTEIAEILAREETKRIQEYGTEVLRLEKKAGLKFDGKSPKRHRELAARIKEDMKMHKRNRFSPIGRVSLTLARIQEIKNVYAQALSDGVDRIVEYRGQPPQE